MAHILVEDGKRRLAIELAPDIPAKVGRALGGAVVLEDGAASREHCVLERTPEGWRVRDLGSRNGTRLNGRPLGEESVPLQPGDRIEIGQAVLSFAGEGDSGKTTLKALEAAAQSRDTSNASASSLAQDPVTGLASFPLLLHELRVRLAPPKVDETAAMHPPPIAVVLVDVDGLGLLNDIFGFRAGDEVIRLVALDVQAAATQFKGASGAVCAREGGGKFGVLLPGFEATKAAQVAEAIRARVAARPLEGPLREASLGVSCGVASAPEDAAAWRELMRRAEAAIARAKREGRDRVARPPKLEGPSGAAAAVFPHSGLFSVVAKPTGSELAPLLLTKEGRSTLSLVAQALGSDLDIDALLELILQIVVEGTDARRGFLVLREARSGELRLGASLDRDGTKEGSRTAGMSQGVIKEALASRDAIVVEDATADARFKKRQSVVLDQPRSVLAAAIRVREKDDEAPLGVLYVDHKGVSGRFGREQKDLVRAIARLIAGPLKRLERIAQTAEELARARLALERSADAEARRHAEHRGLVGESAAIRELHQAIDRAAATDLPVAISGESGAGKELVARAIHAASARSRAAFVAENVAALPETLLEAELFGHARGAFTGADAPRAGLFEAAEGGTLFLDEVAEMSPRLQAKLLRVLQEKEVRRVGEEIPRKVDVRLVTATNKDLDALAKSGGFRTDLLYRIRVFTIDVPPLRARRDDIPRLLDHFIGVATKGGKKPVISREALAILVNHEWPGNVRELENEARKLAALSLGEIGVTALSPSIRGERNAKGSTVGRGAVDAGAVAALLALESGKALPEILEAFERETISRVLDMVEGSRTLTARRLGITRQGLHKKLKRYGMDS
ncbi:sigma 54-interacting transcriptional regulator [bacterium]|nr:sigma 54-interacting transcriptional regulator [bacterium]